MSAIIAVLEFGQIAVNMTAAVLRGELTQAQADKLLKDFWEHKEELERTTHVRRTNQLSHWSRKHFPRPRSSRTGV